MIQTQLPSRFQRRFGAGTARATFTSSTYQLDQRHLSHLNQIFLIFYSPFSIFFLLLAKFFSLAGQNRVCEDDDLCPFKAPNIRAHTRSHGVENDNRKSKNQQCCPCSRAQKKACPDLSGHAMHAMYVHRAPISDASCPSGPHTTSSDQAPLRHTEGLP